MLIPLLPVNSATVKTPAGYYLCFLHNRMVVKLPVHPGAIAVAEDLVPLVDITRYTQWERKNLSLILF